MTSLLYLIPAALMLALCVWFGHRQAVSLRQVLDDADERRRRIMAGPAPASPLDAHMERIVPPETAEPPIGSAALAVIDVVDHARCHPQARPNGRKLADRLRQDCPWLTDAEGSHLCVALTLYAADYAALDGDPWLVFTDAIAYAAVEFSALERTDTP